MSLDVSTLRHRVTLQRRVDTQDTETGEMAVSWEDVQTVWAAIEPLSAREFIASASMQSAVVARIVIRHRDGVDPSMRIKHSRTGVADKIYNIQGVLADKESGLEYLTLPVSLGLNEGE